jgi:predicted molibdopterin-dependent oxidoreductase YjgC
LTEVLLCHSVLARWLWQVEKGPPKPQASCALPAAPGMKIKTDTPMVKKAREGVMEFLLVSSSS